MHPQPNIYCLSSSKPVMRGATSLQFPPPTGVSNICAETPSNSLYLKGFGATKSPETLSPEQLFALALCPAWGQFSKVCQGMWLPPIFGLCNEMSLLSLPTTAQSFKAQQRHGDYPGNRHTFEGIGYSTRQNLVFFIGFLRNSANFVRYR